MGHVKQGRVYFKLLCLLFIYPLLRLFKKSQIISNFTLAFISFRGYLYLYILFLLLQPKAVQNEPVPLGAMLTKGAVRDNLPPVARALALHEFKMAFMLKREVTRLVINSLWSDPINHVLLIKLSPVTPI